MPYRDSSRKNMIVFLVGPTAIGKSGVALSLAKKINAEIISCDSMQIYRKMDIITSKPSGAEMKKTPHHLISLISPDKEYDVARYRLDALRKIKGIIKRGKVPLFVGGSGLYMTILIDGIFNIDCNDQKIRDKLYRQAKDKGRDYLYARLKSVDPQAAVKIHPNDTRRIVRALEVFTCCGKPISQLQKERKGLAGEYDMRIFCLDMPRQILYEKIDQRVEEMFRAGLLKEVAKVLRLKLSKTASFAIGIKELRGYFSGEYDLNAAKCLIQKNTRNYAKRQLTWFRRDKRIEWIQISKKETPAGIARRLAAKIKSRAKFA